MALDDIEDMIGEDEVDRAVVAILRAPIVAPKTQMHRPPRARDEPRTAAASAVAEDDDDAPGTPIDVPGTQLIW